LFLVHSSVFKIENREMGLAGPNAM
jgi:hypothetical protein